ncbi:MAG TPA: PIN domain-containing protein [Terriglobales bacterium]|nr:PIN domain-containing protein [Terriglobales bacterium]
MTYLLDVNVLVALGFERHEFHGRAVEWLRAASRPRLASCAITELGFVRVLSQAPAYGFTVAQARDSLLRLKKAVPIAQFIADTHDISRLPAWARTPKQTTDGHLLELARDNGAVLATFDGKIPEAYCLG